MRLLPFLMLVAACGDRPEQEYTPRENVVRPTLGPEDLDLSEPERMWEDARTEEMVPGGRPASEAYEVRPATTSPDDPTDNRIEQRRDAPLVRDPLVEYELDTDERPRGAWRYGDREQPANTPSPATDRPGASEPNIDAGEPEIDRTHPDLEDEQPRPPVWED